MSKPKMKSNIKLDRDELLRVYASAVSMIQLAQTLTIENSGIEEIMKVSKNMKAMSLIALEAVKDLDSPADLDLMIVDESDVLITKYKHLLTEEATKELDEYVEQVKATRDKATKDAMERAKQRKAPTSFDNVLSDFKDGLQQS